MKAQSKHYGLANGCTRSGATVCTAPQTTHKVVDEEGNESTITEAPKYKHFDSVSQAKRFMRIGYKQ